MITIDEMHDMLSELAGELPEAFFEELNGGVSLLPGAKRDPAAKADDLYVLGEYRQDSGMGRYIVIYYGSFKRLYRHAPAETLREKLREVLRHEFRHHVETLAGERTLEREDAKRLAEYLESYED